MTRAYALRRLAEQFPPEAEQQLSPEDQGILKDLGRQHVTALAQEAAAIDAVASPLLVSLGVSPQPGRATSAPSWQAATDKSLRLLPQGGNALTSVVGSHGIGRRRPNLPQQLSTALAQLRSDVQQCEQLLKP